MLLAEVLDRNCIATVSRVFNEKFELLESLLNRCLENEPEREWQPEILETLLEREKSMSTGMGFGVAIPHCSSVHIKKVKVLFSRLKSPVDFESLDGQPVKICILILFPKQKFDDHITLLASIARLCNDSETRKKILDAAENQDILKIIQDFKES